MLGLESEGQVFRDRFLIADITMTSGFPTERWFWFDPPFHRNQSALLHRQADDVWRVDFQLGWDADPEREKKPESIVPRLRAMLGDEAQFEIEWASVYTFQCRRMRSFRHGRVLFAGDAAHVVSPFGARGANSGIQDADNLAWKLELVLAGQAPPSAARHLRRRACARCRREHPALDAQHRFHHAEERGQPDVSRRGADARQAHPFARRLVNSGGLSLPAVLTDSPLNTADRRKTGSRQRCSQEPRSRPTLRWPARAATGCSRISTEGFTLLAFGAVAPHDAVACPRRRCDSLRSGPGGRATDDRRLSDRGPTRPAEAALRRASRHVLPASAPTSMSARAGGHSTWARCAPRASREPPGSRFGDCKGPRSEALNVEDRT